MRIFPVSRFWAAAIVSKDSSSCYPPGNRCSNLWKQSLPISGIVVGHDCINANFSREPFLGGSDCFQRFEQLLPTREQVLESLETIAADIGHSSRARLHQCEFFP